MPTDCFFIVLTNQVTELGISSRITISFVKFFKLTAKTNKISESKYQENEKTKKNSYDIKMKHFINHIFG
jgi:hypothetical protein